MLVLFTVLLIFILVSRIIENKTKIPTTLTLILLSFLLTFIFPDLLEISNEEFDDILYLMLPVILLPDILNISASELKKHYKEIIYLAIIAVILSITIAVFITPYLLPQYSFTFGMLIALFSMLMATDAITVASIMSKFKLPEKLKIYAESESLFNDVTALIIYYFVALPLISGGSVNIFDINMTLLKVLIFSTVIGMVIAMIGYYVIKILKNSFDQFLVIYLIVIISFLVAEHFHIAGILSIVTSVLVFKYLVQNEFKKSDFQKENSPITNDQDIETTLITLIKKVPALTKKDYREYKKEAEFIGIFANAIVFMILANIIDLHLLVQYAYEILVIFILTSVIRFAAIGALIKKLSLPSRWAKALTYSGTKGALAVIMVHSIPHDFIYYEMFEAIVVGNVLLSTFIYTAFLMVHIKNNTQEYKKDIESFNEESENSVTKNLVNLLEKDVVSGGYVQSFLEEIIEKELSRSQRYKTDLSLVMIEATINDMNHFNNIFEQMGGIIQNKIRTNDVYGRFNSHRMVVITSNTSLSGAMIFCEKIDDLFKQNEIIYEHTNISFGITQASDIDTLESIVEKLNDAILKAKNKNSKGRIEIEA